MTSDDITRALLASYAEEGGINHLDGSNLPSEASINELAVEFMQLLFPGFFERRPVTRKQLPSLTARRLARIQRRLTDDVEKALRFGGAARAGQGTAEGPGDKPAPTKAAAEVRAKAEGVVLELLGRLPALRKVVQTDVQAAYVGDPAARSVDEIILAYPCVLVITLQRIAHQLHRLGVPLLPRILTEYAHERTGADIHPGAQIGSHFFIDHCTGVVIGETAVIGDHVKLYQGVTLGAKSFEVDEAGNPVKGVKRHPEIGDHVTIYAHATILGGNTRIGAHSEIGGNVWLLKSVPAHSIAYYKGDDLVIRARQKKESVVGEAGDWSI